MLFDTQTLIEFWRKYVLTLKKMILTSKQCGKHQFANWNTQNTTHNFLQLITQHTNTNMLRKAGLEVGGGIKLAWF